MTDTTTSTTKTAKTMKPAAFSFGVPDYGILKFEMSKFDLSNMEMPQAFREMAEKHVEQTRDALAKARIASEEAVNLLETTYGSAAKRATDYNNKLIEITRTNMRAAFDNVQQLLGAKSPSQLIELSTGQMCKQFEIVSGQSKEFCALAQKMATEAAGTINTSVSKALNKA
jgi:phasin